MERIKRYHLFFVDKEKDIVNSSDDSIVYLPDGRLRLRITWGKCKADFNLGYRVYHAKWDAKSQRVKRNTFNSKKISSFEINSMIQRFEETQESVFAEFEVMDKTPSKNEYRALFLKKTGRVAENKSDQVIYSHYEEFIKTESRSKSWANATKLQHMSVIGHLRVYNPELKFRDITEKMMLDFADFLASRKSRQDVSEEKKRDLKNSSSDKIFRFFRAFLKWSLDRGVNDNTECLKYRPRLKMVKNGRVLYLTDSELESIKEFNTHQLHLMRVKDIFLFQCHTGLRFSDVMALRWSNIGEKGIKITTKKTIDESYIPIVKTAKEILDKHKDLHLPSDVIFPSISNQKANDNLKEIARLCGLNRPLVKPYFKGSERIENTVPLSDIIGTHCARSTFICRCLSKGIPAHSVMRMTGHNNLKSFQHYLDAISSDLDTMMERFE